MHRTPVQQEPTHNLQASTRVSGKLELRDVREGVRRGRSFLTFAYAGSFVWALRADIPELVRANRITAMRYITDNNTDEETGRTVDKKKQEISTAA